MHCSEAEFLLTLRELKAKQRRTHCSIRWRRAMNPVFFRRSVLAGLGFVAAALSQSIRAERIQIDSGDSDFTPCIIGGAPCAGLTMPFSANFGAGAFNKVYVYNNGLFSFGSEIATGADLSSITSIGGNVFTAGYSPTMIPTTPFQVQDPSNAFNATGVLQFKPVFRVRYVTAFGRPQRPCKLASSMLAAANMPSNSAMAGPVRRQT